nr:MAG TPA: hypothetical protein [Caudoviricetes sp.]
MNRGKIGVFGWIWWSKYTPGHGARTNGQKIALLLYRFSVLKNDGGGNGNFSTLAC